jgi:hypothetical protein
MRNQAIIVFGEGLPGYIASTGLLADELTSPSVLVHSSGASGGAVRDPLDERILPELPYGSSKEAYASNDTYNQLHKARAFLLQAIGQLAVSDTSAKDTTVLTSTANRALRAELYALYGYTEVMLADLFCSGIPLSTLDFQRDFTYKPGSTTAQVYQDAVAKFDTALVLSGDSVRIRNLARVGLARAYLNLAYVNPAYVAAAADDVSVVPSDYQYQLREPLVDGLFTNVINRSGTVADREGGRGQAYLSGDDPRTADTTLIVNYGGGIGDLTVGFPRVYAASLTEALAPITVASGVEARLIEAEAALRRGDVPGWLMRLNQLRATAHIPGAPVLPESVLDTLGVTGCGPDEDHYCSADGVTGGYFQVPANYTLVSTRVIKPVPSALVDVCWSYSFYDPCVNGDSTLVHVYGLNPGSSLLAPLADPGTDSARIALTFTERAAWLYMTGHRQGDLRRQLRQYAQYWPDQSRLYPTGAYPGFGAGLYGSDVTAPIPSAEYTNPLFHGCLSRAP